MCSSTVRRASSMDTGKPSSTSRPWRWAGRATWSFSWAASSRCSWSTRFRSAPKAKSRMTHKTVARRARARSRSRKQSSTNKCSNRTWLESSLMKRQLVVTHPMPPRIALANRELPVLSRKRTKLKCSSRTKKIRRVVISHCGIRLLWARGLMALGSRWETSNWSSWCATGFSKIWPRNAFNSFLLQRRSDRGITSTKT